MSAYDYLSTEREEREIEWSLREQLYQREQCDTGHELVERELGKTTWEGDNNG